MTKQMIAVNSQHAGDRKKDNRGYAESWTSEQLDGLLSEGWLKKMVADIRGGNEKLKDKLPYICPHYGAFKDNHRAQKDIVPESFTFMTCVDVDDVDKVDTAVFFGSIVVIAFFAGIFPHYSEFMCEHTVTRKLLITCSCCQRHPQRL